MYIPARQALGQPPKGRQPDFVYIILIDPSGVFKNRDKLREQIRSKLEDKFNNLDRHWLIRENLRFKVLYRPGEPSSDEKARFGNFDFPVYLLDKQPTSTFMLDLMAQHKIPNIINNKDIYETAKQCWGTTDIRGCGIPSGKGFRKVGFIYTNRVFKDGSRDIVQAFVNVIAHEMGHMGNRLQHSAQGLMKYPIPLHTDIDFDKRDKYLFLSDLQRLRLLKTHKMREFRWVFR